MRVIARSHHESHLRCSHRVRGGPAGGKIAGTRLVAGTCRGVLLVTRSDFANLWQCYLSIGSSAYHGTRSK